MTKIRILGSGREVGKSAIVLENDKKIVIDFGTKIDTKPPSYPPFPIRNHRRWD